MDIFVKSGWVVCRASPWGEDSQAAFTGSEVRLCARVELIASGNPIRVTPAPRRPGANRLLLRTDPRLVPLAEQTAASTFLFSVSINLINFRRAVLPNPSCCKYILELSPASAYNGSRDLNDYWSCAELNVWDFSAQKSWFSSGSKTMLKYPILLKFFL